MFTIMKRRELNPTVTELWIKAPLIAKKAKAGQFIIVRAKEDSERIPLTIAGFRPRGRYGFHHLPGGGCRHHAARTR